MLCVLRRCCSLAGYKFYEKLGDMKGNSVSVPCLHSGGQDRPTPAIPSSLTTELTKQESPYHLKYMYQMEQLLPVFNIRSQS